MTVCDKCGSKFVLSRIVIQGNNSKEEMNLCPDCFKEFVGSHTDMMKGEAGKAVGFILSETMKLINSGIFQNHSQATVAKSNQNKTLRKCPYCFTTEKDIRIRSRAGCAVCYSYFSREIDLFLFSETGMTAEMKSEKIRPSAENIKILKKKLDLAVRSENYELAASLRDEIFFLKKIKRGL